MRAREMALLGVALLLGGGAALSSVSSCSGESTSVPPPPPAPPPAPKKVAPSGPVPTLLIVQAQFVSDPPKPGPARLTLYRTDGTDWFPEVIEDPDSNVFHKAIPFRDGILTIGAMKAMLKHWTRDNAHPGQWKATTLWERSWGGKFDRLRDVEVGDVDGDGKDEIVLATHDMGVVAVGNENEDGTWSFQEFDKGGAPFVHEVEIGDVDGDKVLEFYVTPSDRNKASGASQPGGVVQFKWAGDHYERKTVVSWPNTHAKEILVTDLDGDGVSELYVAREAHIEKGEKGAKAQLLEPAKILRMIPDGGSWKEEVVMVLDGEKQCRFLLPGDADQDGTKDLVAAGMETGLWHLEPGASGWTKASIDAKSGGFEHATLVTDLDGDGKSEIYAASESVTRELNRYTWDGTTWKKTKIDDIPKMRITWSLQPGKF
jgi:hypothetical protein